MKSFYVLFDGSHYLCDGKDLIEQYSVLCYTKGIDEAIKFESLPQALDFINEHGLAIDVLRVDIGYAYSRNLFTEKF